MVTYATPLYDGNRLQGLLAADITLGFLNRFAEQFDGPPGRLILANDHGKDLSPALRNSDILFSEDEKQNWVYKMKDII